MSEEKDILSAEEAAELCGVKPTTIYLHAKQGKLPFIALGKLAKAFRLEDVVAWNEIRQARGSSRELRCYHCRKPLEVEGNHVKRCKPCEDQVRLEAFGLGLARASDELESLHSNFVEKHGLR